MMMKHALLATLAATLLVSCSGGRRSDSGPAAAPAAAPAARMTPGGPDMAMAAPDPNDSAATKGYKAAMMTMMKDAPKTFTGDADIDFMANMRVHHQAAIDMATVELDQGKDAAVKDLAKNIIAAQKKEIGTMNTWLKKKGQ